jgi:K+-sensing histidine kinase KdpD
VVANLVDNALRQAGNAQPVAISAGRSRNGIFIAVRDHGPGLGDADPDTLFARYRQGNESRGAAGLGLAICSLVVQAHGGRIAARRCDPGTEFRIDLPAAAVEEDARG